MLRFGLLFLLPFALTVGNWKKVSVEDVNVRKASELGTKLLSRRTNSLFHSKLIAVYEAEEQIVAGINYRITLGVGYTRCQKSLIKYEDIDTCEFQKGPHKTCKIVVYCDLQQNHQLTHFECQTDPRKTNVQSPHQVHAEKLFFEDFILRHNKVYRDEDEKQERFQIFQRNLHKVKVLNQHERGTARYGPTKFADLTEEEFRLHHTGLRPDLQSSVLTHRLAEIPHLDPLPDAFDWRTHNVVSEVKDQKQCGSCWAFSTTGNIEGQWAIKGNGLVSLSEQELVDCDKVDKGCGGGLQTNAYKEIIRLGGLELESDYPYEAENETCEFVKTKAKVYINDSVLISKNETEMQQWLVKNGPIAIGINANAMQFYYGGVSHPWSFLCDPNNLDHGVLIVGCGVHSYPLFNTTLPFWIIKNSWGATWGEQGYYRVYRGDGTCGLNLMASSAIID